MTSIARLTHTFDQSREDHYHALRQALDQLIEDDIDVLIRALRDPLDAMIRIRPTETPSCPDAMYLLIRLAGILDDELERAEAKAADVEYLMTDARMERAADEHLDALNRSREP